MAEPKKETVRIALPPRPEQAASAPEIAKRETARIVLPSRTPVAPIRRLPPTITPMSAPEATAEPPTVLPRRPPVTPPASGAASPLLQPLPKPPGTEQGPDSAIRPVPLEREEKVTPAPSIVRGPKKETARISILPRPTSAAAPTINMTKTQPLLIHPATAMQPAPVVITSKPIEPLNAIPRSFCWALLGISALIFLIQIWNYVVS